MDTRPEVVAMEVPETVYEPPAREEEADANYIDYRNYQNQRGNGNASGRGQVSRGRYMVQGNFHNRMQGRGDSKIRLSQDDYKAKCLVRAEEYKRAQTAILGKRPKPIPEGRNSLTRYCIIHDSMSHNTSECKMGYLTSDAEGAQKPIYSRGSPDPLLPTGIQPQQGN